MKYFKDDKVYVNYNDLINMPQLASYSIPGIIRKGLGKDYIVIDESNRFNFAEFDLPEEVEFFKNQDWIIDYGEFDDMTSAQKNFFTYSSCLGHDKVCIAYGSLSPIIGKGSVNCTPSITLPLALYIPHFSYNLLSVSALIKNLNCKIEFFSLSL